MMRSANPALSGQTFISEGRGGQAMTIQGTVNKTAVSLGILMVTAFWTWGQFYQGVNVQPFMMACVFGGFIVAMITIFKKTAAPLTTPIYAALEGLFVGGISAYAESRFPGIVIQAVGLTFAVLFSLLAAYTSGMIPVTQNFRLGVAAATGGIMLVYLASWVMSFFGSSIPFIHESGLLGIGFSLFVVVIASMNLVMDFDFIEQGAEHGAPKYMEWFGAFALLVTLIWLYIEILRLLMKLQSRRR